MQKKNQIFLFWETERARAWNKLDSNLGKMNFLFEMQNWTYRPLPSRQDIKTWPEILKREAGYVGISSHQLFYPKNSHFLIIRFTFVISWKKLLLIYSLFLTIDLMQKKIYEKRKSCIELFPQQSLTLLPISMTSLSIIEEIFSYKVWSLVRSLPWQKLELF